MLPAQPTWIAETAVVFLHPDGRRITGRIAVGIPERNDAGTMLCPIALEGLEKSVGIAGEDTLQALLLAIRFMGRMLHLFRSTGGRVLEPDGDEDFLLETYFGVLLAEPPKKETPGPDR